MNALHTLPGRFFIALTALLTMLSVVNAVPKERALELSRTSPSTKAAEESMLERALAAQQVGRLEEARLLLWELVEKCDIKTEPLAWLTLQMNVCHTLCLQQRNVEAIQLAKSIASRFEQEVGIEDPLTNEAISYLAFVLKHVGDPREAEPVYRHNLELLKTKYGKDHPQVARAMARHASLLESLGNINEAEALHREALRITQKLSGHQESPATCIYLTNLGYCLQSKKAFDEARPLMEKAYAILQKHKDEEITGAGMTMRKQAEYYRNTNQLERASEIGRRALLRLAQQSSAARARFFWYEPVCDVYRSILKKQGQSDSEIDKQIADVEQQAKHLLPSTK